MCHFRQSKLTLSFGILYGTVFHIKRTYLHISVYRHENCVRSCFVVPLQLESFFHFFCYYVCVWWTSSWITLYTIAICKTKQTIHSAICVSFAVSYFHKMSGKNEKESERYWNRLSLYAFVSSFLYFFICRNGWKYDIRVKFLQIVHLDRRKSLYGLSIIL